MDPTSFPPGLLDALALHTNLVIPASSSRVGDTIETRLRRQIQAEALQPISSDDLIGDDTIPTTDRNVDFELSSDILEEATQFLRLQVGASDPSVRNITINTLHPAGTRSARADPLVLTRTVCILFLVWNTV